MLLLGGDSFIGILMGSPAKIVAQNFLAQFRILRCFLNLQKQLGEHPSLTNKSDLTIRRIERVLNENAMIMLNSIYRVSHITGPTLFLLFSRVLEHIQRNFS